MKNTYPDGPETFAFSDFENLLRTNGHNKNSIGLSYYSDEEVYRLRELKTGKSLYLLQLWLPYIIILTVLHRPESTS